MTCDHTHATELGSGVEKSGVGCLTQWIRYECDNCGEKFVETYEVASR